MIDFTVVILSYNTKELTKDCLNFLSSNLKSTPTLSYEIIVVDNGSTDGSARVLENLKLQIPNLKIILNKKNVGFPKGNNQTLKIAKGRYVLFLNSDVIVDNVDFKKLTLFLDKNRNIGVLTVKVNLTNGKIDPASHRGFPTIWNSFCYFSGLERLFKNIPKMNIIFGKYHLVYLNQQTIHEIDSPTGAFYLTRKELLTQLKGFDEDYFMYGEDIDLSFRIKALGYKVIYYPLYQVTHLKYASGIEKNNRTVQSKTKQYFYEAMKIFYRKHYSQIHPDFVNKIIYLAIDLKKKAYV